MKILGLSLGELATAAVMVDGTIVAAASEERFSRLKNDERYPRQAIDYCLAEAGITGRELDRVAIAGMSLVFGPWVTRTYSTFSVEDHVRAQREYWYPKLYGGEAREWTEVFKDKLDLQQFPGTFGKLLRYSDQYRSHELWPELQRDLFHGISEHLGIPTDRIVHVDHHTCHAAYAYWGSPFREAPVLVLTADAYGDDLSATISVAADGHVKRVHQVRHDEFMLARMYRYITLVLGMKPNEHEYKVMGLAGYAKEETLRDACEAFRQTMYVDGLGFRWHERPRDMYFSFRDRLEGQRFDGIAGGLQRYCEEILSEWTLNAIRATGVRRVVYSGGISLNVKAMKVLHEQAEVDDLFVCGSGGDESLAIGICYQLMAEHCQAAGRSTDVIRPVSLYLGPPPVSGPVEAWIEARGLRARYRIDLNVTTADVAGHLADGKVIGRIAGRMEFGQRALGNRSILADPRSHDTVEKINVKIKNRDFWMPFAPTVLAEAAPENMVNPKRVRAPFMTIGFDSTPAARRGLPAALHRADRTLRPQVLEREANPDYHAIIAAFRQRTGVGAVLNTSFNLHGHPIVCTADDALDVFQRSDIDLLLVGDVLAHKR